MENGTTSSPPPGPFSERVQESGGAASLPGAEPTSVAVNFTPASCTKIAYPDKLLAPSELESQTVSSSSLSATAMACEARHLLARREGQRKLIALSRSGEEDEPSWRSSKTETCRTTHRFGRPIIALPNALRSCWPALVAILAMLVKRPDAGPPLQKAPRLPAGCSPLTLNYVRGKSQIIRKRYPTAYQTDGDGTYKMHFISAPSPRISVSLEHHIENPGHPFSSLIANVVCPVGSREDGVMDPSSPRRASLPPSTGS